MIFYFSGTGNSKWVAEEMARRTHDQALSISELNEIPVITNEKYVGFVFPIYAWDVPEPMLTFMKQLPTCDAFTYGICTCGADAGIAMKKINKVYPLKSVYSIEMPNNYIVASDLEEESVAKRKITAARIRLDKIAQHIINHTITYDVNEGKLASIKTNLVTKGFNKFARSTKPFYSNEKCIGCGVCEKKCPAKTIYMAHGKPQWRQKCYQCLKCIHTCPQKAIQYGKKTERRSRYDLKNYL